VLLLSEESTPVLRKDNAAAGLRGLAFDYAL